MISRELRPVRLRRREFLSRLIGNGMLAVGGSLFGAAAAYEIYSRKAEAGLAHLKRGNYQIAGFIQPAQPAAAPSVATQPPSGGDASAGPPAAVATAAETQNAPLPAGAEPAEALASEPAVALPGIEPWMLPAKLTIQAIGLHEAKVIEVGTRIEKGQLVWETADHAVGHHIGTAIPGQPGNVVLSGHISSPVRGEGSIFHNLPNLADNLKSTVSIQTGDGTWYYYEIVGTDVVTPSDTRVIGPSANPIVTLLTCVPDGVYTHRFVAIGTYTGKKTANS
jgi:LPXTG-site transpeptidase (sortase) family protein